MSTLAQKRLSHLHEIVRTSTATPQLRRAAQDMIDWNLVLEDAILSQAYDPRPGFYDDPEEDNEKEKNKKKEKTRSAKSYQFMEEPNPTDTRLLAKCDYLLMRALMARTTTQIGVAVVTPSTNR